MDSLVTENDLIQNIVNGKSEDFRIIIDRYQNLVAHIIYRLITNPLDREELGQEIFIKVYRNLSSFQSKSKLSTWIGRIAYNTCLNYLKKKKIPLFEDHIGEKSSSIDNYQLITNRKDAAAQNNSPDNDLMKKQISTFLRQEINHLPVHYQKILTLYHLDEMSYKEIGEIMNLPEGTVKSYLFRGRKLLKDRLLSKYQPEELCL
jgi:RNA polymerase sigma-70 factor (ECF subfamily)